GGINMNKNFDLNKYENVKSRKVRLRNDFPDAFILPFPMSDLNYSGNYVMMGALIWKDKKTFAELDAAVHERLAQVAMSTNTQNVGMVLASVAVMAKADGAG